MLLAGAVVLGTAGLTARLVQLTVAQGDQWRAEAESSLVESRLVPTVRGRILDRHLRVLAEDRPSYDLAVKYPVIDGGWALQRAEKAARRRYEETWPHLTRAEQLDLIAQNQPRFEQQIEVLWSRLCRLGRIERAGLDERLHTIERRVQRMVSTVQLARLRRWRLDTDDPIDREEIARPIGEQAAPHAVLADLKDPARLEVERLIAATASDRDDVWSQVSILPSKKRDYPLETIQLEIDHSTLPAELRADHVQTVTVDGVGIHVIGSLWNSWKQQQTDPFDLDRNLRGYLPGDLAGEWGIERAFETPLRGSRGRVAQRVDTGERRHDQPRTGLDVVSTVDVFLQARVQALLDPDLGLMRVQPWHSSVPSAVVGTPLRGAAVVLDVAQGHVLAAASVPSFTRRQWRDQRPSIEQDAIDRPFWNRATYMPYQPGSIVKPLVLTAAVTARKLAYEGTIQCDGYLLEKQPGLYRCWIYKLWDRTHGALDGPEAVAQSCNIFFHTLGRRMGGGDLVSWYRRFGFGRTPHCGLLEASAGDMPDPAAPAGPQTPGLTTEDSTYMGIGQGPMRITALQAANAYATVARGGYAQNATFVVAPELNGSSSAYHEDLALDPRGVSMALKGLHMAANNDDFGTANRLVTYDNEPIFNIDGVDVYAKTGTATAATRWEDLNGNGVVDDGEYWVDFNRNRQRDAREMLPRGDHAWCIAMVQAKQRSGPAAPIRPQYVVAVVAEYAGSGGLVAGPIVNQILHALRDEGYL